MRQGDRCDSVAVFHVRYLISNCGNKLTKIEVGCKPALNVVERVLGPRLYFL